MKRGEKSWRGKLLRSSRSRKSVGESSASAFNLVYCLADVLLLVMVFEAGESVGHLIVLAELFVLVAVPLEIFLPPSRPRSPLIAAPTIPAVTFLAAVECQKFFHHHGLLPILFKRALGGDRRTLMIFSFSCLIFWNLCRLMRLAVDCLPLCPLLSIKSNNR